MTAEESKSSPTGDQAVAIEIKEYIPALPFHTVTVAVLEKLFGVENDKGYTLTDEQLNAQLAKFGFNELTGQSKVSWVKILIGQLVNAMTFVLLVATILSFATKDFAEAVVLLIVIITNTAIGFNQEYKAEQTMESLRKMSTPTARVVRNCGEICVVPSRNLIPGDIVMFEEGDVIPADARLIECFQLYIDEALLTGESVPVAKNTKPLSKVDEAIGDRLNLVYASTLVTQGRGKGIVVRTGMNTEMGKIAKSLMEAEQKADDQKTPLQKSLDKLALILLVIVLILAAIVFGVNYKDPSRVINYAISIAIAVIPEGIVAVVTITMALGVKRMAEQRAVVRKLVALEELGAVTNICSDKTGTLTQGKMIATRMYVPEYGYINITGLGHQPVGSFFNEAEKTQLSFDVLTDNPQISSLIKCAALCNMAVVKRKGLTETEEIAGLKKRASSGGINMDVVETKPEMWEVFGDTTEAALQVMAFKANMSRMELVRSPKFKDGRYVTVYEHFFDATLKRMTMIYRDERNNNHVMYCKGAVEVILSLCTARLDKSGNMITFKSSSERESFVAAMQKEMESIASLGQRVLGFGYKIDGKSTSEEIAKMKREDVECEFCFLGLVGIYDPPRAESKAAVAECKKAGICIHMITGDHIKTAEAIAKEIGILPSNYAKGSILVAQDFDAISDADLDKLTELPRVIARCSPNTKVKMVTALQRRGFTVAMTGDGTNDAPSLKISNVGIAMGIAGTDVSKQASDIILTDDNFSTIVKAVSEGRRIFLNIQKFTSHLLSANVAEIIILMIGLIYSDKDGYSVYPMSPVEILFLNMVTSTPPAMSLGIEPALVDIMDQPPRTKTSGFGAGIFSLDIVMDILVYGTVLGAISLGSFALVLAQANQPIIDLLSVENQTSTIHSDNPHDKGCNKDYENCPEVFRARGTAFILLSIAILFHAYNCRSTIESIFVGPAGGFKNIYSNPYLFFSVSIGILLSIIVLYIPVLNHKVFDHDGLTWEWIIVIVGVIIFVIFVELFKLGKRVFLRRRVSNEPISQV